MPRAAHGLTTLFHIFARPRGAAAARRSVGHLLTVFGVAAVNREVLQRALTLGWADFEDAVCAAAAEGAGCDLIVTRDASGFRSSPVHTALPAAAPALLENKAWRRAQPDAQAPATLKPPARGQEISHGARSGRNPCGAPASAALERGDERGRKEAPAASVAEVLQDGISLTREQRLERARAIMGAALGLALVGAGWRRRSAPGEFHIDRDGEHLDPLMLIRHLSDGTLSQDAWEELHLPGIETSLRSLSAANARQARMSSRVRSGKSRRISSSDMPEAR